MSIPRVLEFVNPATGERFGEIPAAAPEEIPQAIQELRAAAPAWANRPLDERIRILRKFLGLLIDARDEITAVINQDTGKSRQDALVEVLIQADYLHTYLKHAPRWLRREAVSSELYFTKRAAIEHRPYGVVLVLAPWNYPLVLALSPLLGALLAGNVVVLKPSEVAPATGAMIAKLLGSIPELAPVTRVLHGDGAVGAALVAARPDYIFLTGSTATGKAVSLAAAEGLIPGSYELGGKDAMLVLEDADLPAAAHWGVWAAHYNAGQSCVAVERAYVVQPVFEQFVKLAVAETQALEQGFSTAKNSHFNLGPITDPRQLDTVEKHLKDALQKGAHLLTGGERRGSYITPAVLVDVDESMLIMQEETFGPVLPILAVANEDEAIARTNTSSFGLGVSIWSRDLKRARRVASRLKSGAAVINDAIAHFAVPLLPFGGVDDSGYGRTHGKEGLLQFTYSFAILEGGPPLAWDIATVARQAGRYDLVAGILRLAFGVSSRQRLEPVVETLAQARELSHKDWSTVQRRLAPFKPALGAATLALGAFAGAALFAGKRRKH
ncbi:MAG TPA: aldehyde dehydrogenase family protein [Anaerolineales bacterium]|nr:aldehyde dehydrogenase family protein [Anaerolineales bacterium]